MRELLRRNRTFAVVNDAVMKIGILREGKMPPDLRVPLSPSQCAQIISHHPNVEIIVEPSPIRAYSDAEYLIAGVTLSSDLSDCDLIMGVKEVPLAKLMPNKPHLFFSHTHKAQVSNRKLLKAVLQNGIRLIDYELLTNDRGERLIAFGYYAGVVGAHNGVMAYGQRTQSFDLPRLKDCHDYKAATEIYQQTQWPSMRVVLTGTGRVATGAKQTLIDMGFAEMTPNDFLSNRNTNGPVFTRLSAAEYVRRKDGSPYVKQDFYTQPQLFESAFGPYASACDLFINGIYWNTEAPAFFNLEELKDQELIGFNVIADITCDIAPESSVPTTTRPSTIAEPLYGVNRYTLTETQPFEDESITVMAIDNLPTELPRDATSFFGRQFIENVLPELLQGFENKVIARATIAKDGQLMPAHSHLESFVAEGV